MPTLKSLSTISESLFELQATNDSLSLSKSCNCQACKQTSLQTDAPIYVKNISDVANETIKAASIAASAGTFGVGGILIDNSTGEIIHSMPNAVVQKLQYTNINGDKLEGASFPLDPTNHGERQMVSWYYKNRAKLNLKSPNEYTIATSLDPCAMCSGSLITAGFNVAVIAPDSEAGTNWTDLADYPQLDYRLKELLSDKFGYYAVSDQTGPRSIYRGNQNLLFADQFLTKQLYDGNTAVFTKTVEKVRDSVSGSGLPKDQMLNPKTLPVTSKLRTTLHEADSDSFSLILSAPFSEGSSYYKPSAELYRLLKQRMETEKRFDPRIDNAVGLVDPFGNLLMIRTDKFIRQPSPGEDYEDPINTAFMSLIQDYSAMRFKLISEASLQSNSIDGYRNSDEFKALTSPKNLTFIFLKGLSPGATTTLKDLGAYGSSVEGSVIVGNFQFIEPPSQGNSKQFMQQIRSLPPLYGSAPPDYFFNLQPTQTQIESLDINVTSLADSGKNSLRQAIELANNEKIYRRILISSPGTIKLESDLPSITQKITIVGALNGNTPTVAINANGYSGIQLSSTAIGTSIENLLIHGASGKGIQLLGSREAWNNSLSISNTILGQNINGSKDANKAGGISELNLGIDHYLDGWREKILNFDNYNKLSNKFLVSDNINGVIARHDSGSQADIKLIFEKLDAETGIAKEKIETNSFKAATTNSFSPLDLKQGLLIANGTDGYFKYLSSEGKSQGSNQNIALSSGSYNVYAIDSNGRRYGLRELRSSSNGVAMRLHHEKDDKGNLVPSPDGEPISISLSLASTGTNTILQSGEVSLRISRLGMLNNSIAFYPVSDPLTGIITLNRNEYLPSDSKYLSTALQLAKNHDLLVNPILMPAYQESVDISLKNLDPSISHGLLLLVDGNQQNCFSSYSAANPAGASQFLSIATGDGSLMFGVEDLLSTSQASDRDFNDLFIQSSGYKLIGT